MNSFEGHILIQQGSESVLLRALKSHNLNPNAKFRKDSLLASAVKRNFSNIVKLFLQYGGDPNLISYENGRYEPPIITAVRYKSLPCVQLLLKSGANLSKTNFYGTDAIFQAVHENTHDVLDYLLSEYVPPRYTSLLSIVKEASQDVKSQERKSNGKKLDKDDDHTLCPFYYALTYSTQHRCKRHSLVRLLQTNYKCKCLHEVVSCGKQQGISRSSPLHRLSPGTPTVRHLDLPEESIQAEGEQSKLDIEQVRKCLMLATTQKRYTSQLPSSHLSQNNLDSGNNSEMENLLQCAYKIYKIKRKCHTINDNKVSSASYVVLLGPLKLSFITREVIRDQIMLCGTTVPKSSPLGTHVNVSSAPPQKHGTKDVEIGVAKSFPRSLGSLATAKKLPESLINFLLYRSTSLGEVQNVTLMEQDSRCNTDYYAVYIGR